MEIWKLTKDKNVKLSYSIWYLCSDHTHEGKTWGKNSDCCLDLLQFEELSSLMILFSIISTEKQRKIWYMSQKINIAIEETSLTAILA